MVKKQNKKKIKPRAPVYMKSFDAKAKIVYTVGVPIRQQIWNLTLYQDGAPVTGNVDPTKDLTVYGKAMPTPVGDFEILVELTSQDGWAWPATWAIATTMAGFDFEATFGAENDIASWDEHFTITCSRATTRLSTRASIDFDV